MNMNLQNFLNSNDWNQEPLQRNRAWRIKTNFHKALHKKYLSSYYCQTFDWYNNLNQYSKNKIHCSCSICRLGRTKDSWCTNGRHGGRNWKPSDLKKWERMDYDYEENVKFA